MKPGGVFISYRRSDAGGYAGRIYDRLSQRFGAAVFMDTTALRLGEDFMAVIQERIAASRAVVVLVGTDWLALDARGTSRLDHPDDPVRLELEHALRCNVAII